MNHGLPFALPTGILLEEEIRMQLGVISFSSKFYQSITETRRNGAEVLLTAPNMHICPINANYHRN